MGSYMVAGEPYHSTAVPTALFEGKPGSKVKQSSSDESTVGAIFHSQKTQEERKVYIHWLEEAGSS